MRLRIFSRPSAPFNRRNYVGVVLSGLASDVCVTVEERPFRAAPGISHEAFRPGGRPPRGLKPTLLLGAPPA